MTKFLSASILKGGALGPRQVRVIASTPTPDRVGDIVVPQGIVLTNYRRNPVVLFAHNPEFPVGTAIVDVTMNRLEALINFAPEGASEQADETCSLVKNGVLNAVSIGFNPIRKEPISGGGWKIVEAELIEISIVATPCNAEALVIQRSINEGHDMTNHSAVYAKQKKATSNTSSTSKSADAAKRRAEIAALKAKGDIMARSISSYSAPTDADFAARKTAEMKASALSRASQFFEANKTQSSLERRVEIEKLRRP